MLLPSLPPLLVLSVLPLLVLSSPFPSGAHSGGYGTTTDATADCRQKCDIHHTNEQFEACLFNCTKHAKTANYYPPPPHNVTVLTEVVIDGGKILETTVHWNYIEDPERTGFYLRVTAIGKTCEQSFPGYSISDLKPTAKSHAIPLVHNNRELLFEHECTYRVEMHSKPYPYSDPLYTVITEHTVPTCLQGYCTCKQDTVPLPENVSASATSEGVLVHWSVSAAALSRIGPAPRHSSSSAAEPYLTFYFSLLERFHPPIAFSDPNAFRFRIVQEAEFHHEVHELNQTTFSTLMPAQLKTNEEYKVSMFAVDAHYCNTKDVFAVFHAPAVLPTPGVQVARRPSLPDSSSAAETDARPSPRRGSSSASPSSPFPSRSDSFPQIPPPASPTTPTVMEKEVAPSDWLDQLRKDVSAVSASTPHILVYCLVIAALMSPVCSLGCIVWARKRRKSVAASSKLRFQSISLAHSRHSILESNILYRRPIEFRTPLTEEDWHIAREEISVGRIIGEGAFGMVCKGSVVGPKGMPVRVAIKQLKTNAADEERREFHREIDMMKKVGKHPNIVTMYGYCLHPDLACMVMEYVPFGDLKHYLQSLRRQLSLAVSSLKSSLCAEHGATLMQCSLTSSLIEDGCSAPLELQYLLDPNELQSFASQVAAGMAHLEYLGVTHRDLAARNILVGEHKQLKISDFGMSRPGIYVKLSKSVIPLRWLSIEAIRDNIYSTKSDVWAFGVVLWEICTLGGFPYPTIADSDLLSYLLQGHRLEKPISCSDDIYNVMVQCWSTNSSNRPTFACLADELGELKSPYVEFLADATTLPPHDITGASTASSGR